MPISAIRQITAALGLDLAGGPCPDGASADRADGGRSSGKPIRPLTGRDALSQIRAHAAAVDNIALFFGEDIFIAIASILLIKGVLAQNGIDLEPMRLAVWAIPTAVSAFVIHAIRLMLLDRRLARDAAGPRWRP